MANDTRAPSGLTDIWLGSRTCPACLGSLRRVTTNGYAAHWMCQLCGRCWGGMHGRLHRVDPLNCGGCASRPREACIALVRRELPAGEPG